MPDSQYTTCKITKKRAAQIKRVAKARNTEVQQEIDRLLSYGLTATGLRKIADGNDDQK